MYTGDAMKKACSLLDLDEVISYLRVFPRRTIKEELEKAIKQKVDKDELSEEDVKEILKQKMGEQNVNDWLEEEERGINRESAIKIAFVLQMNYIEADTFLRTCWLDMFHMRDVRDVIYRYGLENEWTYELTNEMIAVYADFNRFNTMVSDDDDNEEEEIGYTELLDILYENNVKCKDTKALENFLQQNRSLFGSFYRTAYKRFMKYYNQIKEQVFDDSEKRDKEAKIKKTESRNWEKNNEEQYAKEPDELDNRNGDSAKQIKSSKKFEKSKDNTLDEEIRRWIVENLTDLEREGIYILINRGVPRRREAMSEIINRYIKKRKDKEGKIFKEDIIEVNRTFLILTWLSCNDGDITTYQLGKAIDNFEKHKDALNEDILEICSMAILDPRHPFDWIILNSLYVGHVLGEADEKAADVKERMRKLFEKIIEG